MAKDWTISYHFLDDTLRDEYAHGYKTSQPRQNTGCGTCEILETFFRDCDSMRALPYEVAMQIHMKAVSDGARCACPVVSVQQQGPDQTESACVITAQMGVRPTYASAAARGR